MYESKDRMVSHPNHYISETGMEVIDVIEAFTSDLKGIEAADTANIIKYACRWKKKNGIQDLEKILWYAQHLIDHLKKMEKVEEENKIIMKKAEIVKSMNGFLSKTSFQLKKHSPEILVVAGVIGVVTSAVMACKATTKVGEILDKTKEDVETIHKCEADESVKERYSSEDAQKDLAIVYVQTGMKFAKLYGPSVILGALSITSILASNNILRKRNVALSAAYAAIDKGFKEYRSRVIERFGEEVDRELKYNLKAKKFDETVIDEETGKEKKVKKNGFVVSPADISGYARFFEKYTQDEDGNSILNPHWESNNEYNLMFIKAQERYANDLLKAKKRVFLNEVYEMLGLPRTKAGQIVGWVYNPENSKGDNYIDFGLYSDNLSYSDYVNGFDQAILLDFNVDGNIWDLM